MDSANEVDGVANPGSKPWVIIVFIIFISVTSFFLLNTLITILIDAYQQQATKDFSLARLSLKQKHWVILQPLLLAADISPRPKPPTNQFRLFFYHISLSKYFDYFISLCVAINTVGMCMEYASAPEWYM